VRALALRLLVPAVLTVVAGCRHPAASPDDFVTIDMGDDLDPGCWAEEPPGSCGTLHELEPAALMGRLDEQQTTCLETTLAQATRVAVRDRLSRMLMVDAWGKADEALWLSRARRHVLDIDGGDPDISYRLTHVLLRVGDAAALEEAMHWSTLALDRQEMWHGDLWVRRVTALHRMRTEAATGLVDQAHPDAASAALRAREQARRWMAFVHEAGIDDAEAVAAYRRLGGP